MLLGATLALALVGSARAGEASSQAVVQTDRAEVRCKPGTEPSVYVTQTVARGEVVQVVRRLDNGWLEIVPPKGSYSWINTRGLRCVNEGQHAWMVASDGGSVPVLVGSPYKPGKPDVIGTTLARGAQVVAVGDPHPSDDGDGLWLPIMPPAGEYRYIRQKDVAVVPSSPSAATMTVAHPGSGGTFASPGAGPQPAADNLPPATKDVHVGGPAGASDVDPLLQQAEQLERSGDRAGAARLYDQLGNKYFNSNHDAAMQYYNRAGWLRGNAPAAPRPANEAEALYQQAQQAEQAGNRAEAARAWARLGNMYAETNYALAMQYYNRASWLRQGQPSAPAGPAAQLPAAGVPARSQQSGAAPVRAVSVQLAGPGRLTRSATWLEGRATYVLESPQAQVLAYLTPEPGVDLEHYTGQNVRVLGQVVPHPELRVPCLTVTRVDPLPAP
jgi:hypothetical protein